MWGFEKFSLLINKIIESHKNIKIFIVGSKEEKKFETNFNWNNIINCIGIFKIEEVIYLIKKSDVFLGCNSSLQYFAAYSNVKTCVIYGYSTPSKRWMPKVNKQNFIFFQSLLTAVHANLMSVLKIKNINAWK